MGQRVVSHCENCEAKGYLFDSGVNMVLLFQPPRHGGIPSFEIQLHGR